MGDGCRRWIGAELGVRTEDASRNLTIWAALQRLGLLSTGAAAAAAPRGDSLRWQRYEDKKGGWEGAAGAEQTAKVACIRMQGGNRGSSRCQQRGELRANHSFLTSPALSRSSSRRL